MLLSRPYMRSKDPQFLTCGCSSWRIFWEANCFPTRLFLPVRGKKQRWRGVTNIQTEEPFLGVYAGIPQEGRQCFATVLDTMTHSPETWTQVPLCRAAFRRSRRGQVEKLLAKTMKVPSLQCPTPPHFPATHRPPAARIPIMSMAPEGRCLVGASIWRMPWARRALQAKRLLDCSLSQRSQQPTPVGTRVCSVQHR